MIIRSAFIFFVIMFFTNCSKTNSPETKKIGDDYVLVEFSAKLEDDFHKVNGKPENIKEKIKKDHP